MNIVVINQPLNNRGDEAAHKSLMRTLSRKFPDDTIQVLFQGALQDSINQIMVNAPNITYYNFPRLMRGSTQIKKYALILNIVKLSTQLRQNRKISKMIQNGDLIICAPGGICMGLFQNWQHIYWLSVAKAFKRKIVYYSRSFGPFPENNYSEKCFKKISLNLLKYFDFLSIRDSKTMALADELKIQYIPSIDTAFLDSPDVLIPDNLMGYLKKPYIVFVPNSLAWHKAYRNIDQNIIDNYYIEILNIINTIYKNYTIVLLPQLYNINAIDKVYFKKIADKTDYTNLIVLDDTLQSDIQQAVIGGCEFVIGSRYHSIVFAINNNKPVIALSYEHKISGLLQILDMADSLVNFEEIVLSNISLGAFADIMLQKIRHLHPNKEVAHKARMIAENCMNQFVKKYKDQI
jgi:colanic acid/amylovoran biosynthesis protein